MRKKLSAIPTRVSNLYRFIRLILGDAVSDRVIARKWKMDGKNFSNLKTGKYPVPRIDRLVTLARILDVDDHLVYKVAKGTPAQRVYYLIEKMHLKGDRRTLVQRMPQMNKIISQSERCYHELFDNVSNAVLMFDIKTGEVIECNAKAERLLGRPRKAIIGLHYTQLHPVSQRQYYRNRFQRRLIHGKNLDMVTAQIIRPDGRITPVLITTNVIELDGRSVLIGTFRDISQIKTITLNYHSRPQARAEDTYAISTTEK